MAILKLTDICKDYQQGREPVRVLKNICLTVEKGDYLAIMGPSGSGKTTLLNILAALDKPTAGSVVLDGKDLSTVRESDIAAFRRDNLGFVFQGTTTDANFKFHMEGSNTYWFRCAGAFSWIAPIKKQYTFDEVNAIRKLEFVVAPADGGLLDISIYINDTLYGTQAGRTNAFANGEEGCVFILDAGLEPASGDYCVIKSITYISE